MTKLNNILFLFIVTIVFISCEKSLKVEKYERPEWLKGKVYTQILDQPELSTFAKCLEITGYDTIIDVSGSYTVFAPSDDAWKSYIAEKPEYNSIDDIPIDYLKKLVKYHLIQNAWTKQQLRTLDIYGWIDTLDLNNNKPKGFKRETLEKEPNKKYGVESYSEVLGEESKVIIVDTTESDWYRRVITDSRKYAPIFYQEYFDIYNLTGSDYTFYFDRTFDGGNNIYFAGAKIVSDEIFAENGFVYIVDKVVEPMDNAMEMLTENKDNTYDDFLDIVNQFPKFEYNEQETFDQPGAELGLDVDSLFDLTFPYLTFDLNAEKTSAPKGTYGLPENVTVRYHHGLIAPTNNAFNKFVNDYVKIPGGWGSLDGMPERIKRIIVNSYLCDNTIYPSDFNNGFYNGENDIVRLSSDMIVEKKFGSNCSFIGVNEAIIPRAFKSITGPVYLQQGYNKVMYAVEESGLLPTLKRPGKNYMFFVEDDINTSIDSSFFYNPKDKSFFAYLRSPKGAKYISFTIDDVRTMLLNQVAVRQPTGIPRKEFIPNLAGNYIIVNNVTGEYSGTSPTTDGYYGSTIIPEFPTMLNVNSDNGKTFSVVNWFSFSGTSLFLKISNDFPRFHGLLKKAGLTNDAYYKYRFISNSEFYTVLIPTDQALDDADVDNLPVEELKSLLLLHFIKGEIIFTDGSADEGNYETCRIDDSSTEFTTNYTRIHVVPGIDNIEIQDNLGNEYVKVVENDASTNILTAVHLGKGDSAFPVMFNNAVIHSIDKVLDVNVLDIR